MPTIQRSGVLARNAVSALPVRAALGASMIFHGYTKLAGPGPEKAGEMMEKIGATPGKPWAIATGIAEVFAGASAVLGLWTRPAALAVLVTQAVAASKVHAKNGYDITKGGYEYNLALMAIAAGLLLAGPGPISAHEGLEHLAEGRGPRRLFRKTRPSGLLRFIKLLK